MGFDEFLGKWGVFLCSIADGILIGFGFILGVVAFYYSSTIGGSEEPTTAFILLSVTMVLLGIVGVVGLILHQWLIIFVANCATGAMFVGMFSLMVVSMMIGYDYTDPVKDATRTNWKTTELQGQEPIRVQMETQGLCNDLDVCKEYYPAMADMITTKDWSPGLDDATIAKCNGYTATQFATDCKHTQECKYLLSTSARYGCKACDEMCFDLAVDAARDNMQPLAYVSFFAFTFLFGVSVYNDFLMERDSFAGAEGSLFDGAKDRMEWIGIGLNGFNAFMGFVLFILGFVYSSDTGAAIAILLLGVGLMGACSTVAGGIYLQNKLTPLLLFAGNAGSLGLAFLLLLAGIVAGLSAGLVTNIGEKIDDDWDRIRGEMAVANPHYCAYMDDDQCKLKIKTGIQDQAVNLAWIMLFVLSFLVGKIYVTHRVTKFMYKFSKSEHSRM